MRAELAASDDLAGSIAGGIVRKWAQQASTVDGAYWPNIDVAVTLEGETR